MERPCKALVVVPARWQCLWVGGSVLQDAVSQPLTRGAVFSTQDSPVQAGRVGKELLRRALLSVPATVGSAGLEVLVPREGMFLPGTQQ